MGYLCMCGCYTGGGGGGGGGVIKHVVKITKSEEQKHTGKVMNLEYSYSDLFFVVCVKASWTLD